MISDAVKLVLDERIITKLSLAVTFIDDFTKKDETVEEVKVTIPSLNLNAKKIPSGYYNFLDIPDDTYTLDIKSEYYINEKVDVSLPLYTIRNPLRFNHRPRTPLRKLIPFPTKQAQIRAPEPSTGDISICMKNITVPINIDDIFIIEDSELSNIEFCQIELPLPLDPDTTPYFITLPLRFDHKEGVYLRKMTPEPDILAEIDCGSYGANEGDLKVRLKNVSNSIYPNDVVITEGTDADIIQLLAPMINITLKPNYLYPFPLGATLIRGEVKDAEGKPFSKASIELVGDGQQTKTSSKGEFVLYFPASQEDAQVQIKVTPQGRFPTFIDGEVRKGKTTLLSIIYT